MRVMIGDPIHRAAEAARGRKQRTGLPTTRGCVRGNRTGLSAGYHQGDLRTADTETLGSVMKQRTDLSKWGGLGSLDRRSSCPRNSDVILRYYPLPLRWCADVRGTREGDKGSCLPQRRRATTSASTVSLFWIIVFTYDQWEASLNNIALFLWDLLSS